MGLRQRDLSWAARESLELYCQSKSKLLAVDRWLETHPLIDERGEVAAVGRFYVSVMGVAVRTLGELRELIAESAREDARFSRALEVLAAEGAKTRAGER
jgi:hypothetical protein